MTHRDNNYGVDPKSLDPREYGKDFEFIKHITHPETYSLWSSRVAAAKRGEIEKTTCPHHVHNIQVYSDDAPGREDKPINLFHCLACNGVLRLVDVWGRAAADG